MEQLWFRPLNEDRASEKCFRQTAFILNRPLTFTDSLRVQGMAPKTEKEQNKVDRKQRNSLEQKSQQTLHTALGPLS